MQGVYSAGIVTALQRANVYDCIEAIYSASAGSLVAAYFLSHQAELGSSIYLEDLNTDFISPRGFALGILDRLTHHYLKGKPRKEWHNAIAIEYLFDIVKNEKILDITLVSNQSIPLYTKVINLSTMMVEYHDVRGIDTLSWLRAAVDVMPYTTEIQTIRGTPYADAGIMEVIGLDTLKERHPDSKIIVILNGHKKRRWSQKVKNFLEAYFIGIGGYQELTTYYRNAEKNLRQELENIPAMDNVYLSAIPDCIPIRSRTTEKSILKKTYFAGIEAGNTLLAHFL